MSTVSLAGTPAGKYRLASNIRIAGVDVAKAGMVLDEATIDKLTSLHITKVYVRDAERDIFSIPDIIDNATFLGLKTALKLQNIDYIKISSKQLVDMLVRSDILIAPVSTIVSKCTKEENLIDHCIGTAIIACEIAIAAKFGIEDIQYIVAAGLLHDLGKHQIPDEILFAPRKLTQEEKDIIKQHTIYGYNMLLDYKWTTQKLLQAVKNHHENYDGTGYPNQLKGDEIGDFASILHIADVYDALTRPRSYKQGWAAKDVIEYLQVQSGTMFDPKYVQALVDTIPIYEKGTLVRLSTQQLAVIVRNSPKHIFQPTVLCIDAKSGTAELNLAGTNIFVETAVSV